MADNDLADVQQFLKKSDDAPGAPPSAPAPGGGSSASGEPRSSPAPVKIGAPTITVFDNFDKKVVAVDPSVVASDPTRFAEPGEQVVKMTDPTGKVWNIPAKNAADAAGIGGYSYQSRDQVRHDDKIDWKKGEIGNNPVMAGLLSASNTLFGGVGDILDKKYNPEEAEARAQIEAEHPYGTGAGTAVGVVGQLALDAASGGTLSGLAKGVEGSIAGAGAGFGMRTLGRVAGGALEGAAFTAPEVTAHLAVGDNQAAAESLGTSMAMGGVLHGVLGGLGDAWRHFKGIGAEDKAGLIAHGLTDESGNINMDNYQKLSKNLEVSKIGVSPAAVSSLGDEGALKISRLASDNGLETLDLSKLRTLKSQIGEEVEEASKNLGKVGDAPLDGLLPNKLSADAREAIEAAHPGVQMPPGGKLKGIDEYNAFKAAEPARNEMNRISGELEKLGSDPVSLNTLQEKLNDIKKVGAKLSDPGAQAVHSLAIEKLSQAVEDARSQAFANGPLSGEYAKYLSNQQQLQTINSLVKMGPKAFVPTDAAAKLSDLDLGGNIAARLGRRAVRTVVSHGIGAAAGGLLGAGGGPLGFVAGSMAGGWAQKRIVAALGDKALEYAGASKALGLSTKILKQVADNPETSQWLGAALAKNVANSNTSQIATVANALIGKSALAKQQQDRNVDFVKAQQAIVQQKADEQTMNNHAASLASVFGHDPELQSMVHNQQLKTINYLYDNMPKSDPPPPFQKQAVAPSKIQQKQFMDRFEVAKDPASVIQHAKDGTLTDAHVDALKNLFPDRYGKIVDQVNAMAHDPNTPAVSYGLKKSLSTLTGQNLANPNNINYQQAIYGNVQGGANNESAFGPQGKGKKGGGAPKQEKFKIDKMPDLSTSTQKRSNKGGF